MPRSVDLSQAPPPQARCYSCGHTVDLASRARARGKFRCPYCRHDNRVGRDGLGAPLRGEVEPAEAMPQLACTACGSTNRLPLELRYGRQYRCFACDRLHTIPRSLRLRRASRTLVALATFALLVAGVFGAGLFVLQLRHFNGELRDFELKAAVAEMNDSMEMERPRALISRGGVAVTVAGSARNLLPHTVTLFVHVTLLRGADVVLQQTVVLSHVKPHEQRRFTAEFNDPSGRQIDAASVNLFGVG